MRTVWRNTGSPKEIVSEVHVVKRIYVVIQSWSKSPAPRGLSLVYYLVYGTATETSKILEIQSDDHISAGPVAEMVDATGGRAGLDVWGSLLDR